MPSIGKRVYGLLRGRFSPTNDERPTSTSLPSSAHTSPSKEFSFIHNYLHGLVPDKHHPQVYYGKTGVDLPKLLLERFGNRTHASCTGPDGGLLEVPPVRRRCDANAASLANMDDELDIDEEYGGLGKENVHRNGHSYDGESDDDEASTSETFDQPTAYAYGASTSLYEHPPIYARRSGHPIADCFATIARRNHCILALADGVNWGVKARLAAQCAIRGAMDHVSRTLASGSIGDSQQLFHTLLGAFHAGHRLIIQENGQLTTLCVTVVCKLKGSSCWLVCACNVGDSLCFVHSAEGGTREVTLGSHDIDSNRDMRDAGGALGPVDGMNPELRNLTCSMTFVDDGDLVFITSDGISDNFDPVVGKFCVIGGDQTNALGLPTVTALQRHELMLLRMDDLLMRGVNGHNRAVVNARQLVDRLIEFATSLTRAKRGFLEDPDLYIGHEVKQNREAIRRQVRCRLGDMPGKLDHASVVAYLVGVHDDDVISHVSVDSAQCSAGEVVVDGRQRDSTTTADTSGCSSMPSSEEVPPPTAELATPTMEYNLPSIDDDDEDTILICNLLQRVEPTSPTLYANAHVLHTFQVEHNRHQSVEAVVYSVDKSYAQCSVKSPPVERRASEESCSPSTPLRVMESALVTAVQESNRRSMLSEATTDDDVPALLQQPVVAASFPLKESYYAAVMNDIRESNADSNNIRVVSPTVSTSKATAKATSAPPLGDEAKKKRKHARGTIGRHTFGGDSDWFKRLIPARSSVNSPTTDKSRLVVSDSPPNAASFRSIVESPRSTRKWLSRLKMPWQKEAEVVAPLRMPHSSSDHNDMTALTFPPPPKHHFDALGQHHL